MASIPGTPPLDAFYNYADPKRDGWFGAGWCLGNFSIYRAAAKACKGDVSALRAAAAARQFEGTINDDGTLTFMGATLNWRDFEAVA